MTPEASLIALACPTRRKVFERLRLGPQAVGRIAAGLPVSRAAVSQHLKVLWEAGLVGQQRCGRQCIYHVDPNGLEQLRCWIDLLWDEALCHFQALTEAGDQAWSQVNGCEVRVWSPAKHAQEGES